MSSTLNVANKMNVKDTHFGIVAHIGDIFSKVKIDNFFQYFNRLQPFVGVGHFNFVSNSK